MIPERYQTVYSKTPGSAAAPTAGLHFTKELLEALKAKGVKLAFVTLHVGLGTFRPVKEDEITDHVMHSEYLYHGRGDRGDHQRHTCRRRQDLGGRHDGDAARSRPSRTTTGHCPRTVRLDR